MRRIRFMASTLLLLAGISANAADGSALTQEIEQADQALFHAIFDKCDSAAVADMVTDDFEFFHDKWGQIAKSKDEFVKIIRDGCERQRAGTDFKASRELTPSTLKVYPMEKYGALEFGEHAFFKIDAKGKRTPTEHARFAQLWRLDAGKWRLSRVFSYAHVDNVAPGVAR